MKRILLIAACASSVLSSACYMRRPIDQAAPPAPSTRIVAALTDSGTVAMSNALGPGVLEVEGVLAAADENVWTLQMLRADTRDARSIQWSREPVPFPRNYLVNPAMIVLDKKRSWLAAVGITAGTFLIARSFNLIGNSEDDDNTTEPEQSWVPTAGQ